MGKIKTVLFDIGGVLLTNGWDRAERLRVFKHFALDPADHEQRHEPANDAWEKGLITAQEFLARTIFFQPRSFTSAEFLEQMKLQSRELPSGQGAMAVLQRLRGKGAVRLAAISNEARELTGYRIEHFCLERYFDAFFVSCFLGLRKPDPRIFMLVLDVLQLRPEETAFVDDRQENCDSARNLGMHAIPFCGEASLAAELARLEVPGAC